MTDPGSTLMRGLLEVFILERLHEAPRHGYALLKEMGACFGSEPNRNKIYPLLSRLEKEGLLQAVPDGDNERGKTAYVLTESGRAALEAYRELPPPFFESLRAVWGGSDAPADPPPPLKEAPDVPATEVPHPPEGARGLPAPSPDGAPYPCPDARVQVEKSPRSGDLTLRLTGCPMGAYDYCPRCPVYQGVEGVRQLTFG